MRSRGKHGRDRRAKSSWGATGAVLGAVAAFGCPAWGANYQWTTATSGSWTDPARWTPNTGFPDDGADEASIFAGPGAYTVTLGGASDVTVGRVQLSSLGAELLINGTMTTSLPTGFRLAGGRLTVAGTLRVMSGTFELATGTVTGTVRLGGINPVLNFSSSQGSGGTYVFEDSGTIQASVGLRVGQALIVRADTTDTTVSSTSGLQNAGTLTLTSAGGVAAARLALGSGFLNNNPGGVVSTEVGSGGARLISSAQFANFGTFNVNADTAVTAPVGPANPAINNVGTVNVSAGVVLLASGFRQAGGMLNIGAGGQLRLESGMFELSGGTVSGTVSLSGTNPVLNFSSSQGSGGNYVFEDSGTIQSGVGLRAGQTLLVRGDANDTVLSSTSGLQNSATITLASAGGTSASNLSLGSGFLNNNPGGVINSNAGSGGQRTIASGQFANFGTFNVNTDTTVTAPAPNAAINNGGTVNVSAGVTLTAPSFRQGGGVINFGAGAALQIVSGQFELSGGTVNGTVHLTGTNPVLNFSSSQGSGGTYVFESSGSVQASVGLRTGQALVVRGHGPDTVLSSTGGFQNSALLSMTSMGTGASRLALGSGFLNNNPGGVVSVEPGAGGARSIASGQFANFGTFNVGADTTVTTTPPNAAINNGGTVNVSAGVTLTTPSFRQGGGLLNMGSGAAVRITSGQFELSGGTVVGTVRLTGTNPTLTFSSSQGGGGTYVFEDGGTLQAGPGVRAGLAVLVRGDTADTIVASVSGLQNSGLITLTSAGGSGAAGLSLGTGFFNNEVAGVVNVEAGSGGARTIASGQMQNFGTFNVGANTTVTGNGANAAILNGGTVNVSAGVTLTAAPFRQSGGVLNIGAGGAVRVNSGTFELAGGTVNGTVRLTGANPTLNLSTSQGAGGRYVFEDGGTLQSGGGVRAGMTVVVQGDAADTTVTGPSFLNNAGVITLASAGGTGASILSVGSGTLSNAPAGAINADPGSGGARQIVARRFDNLGTFNVNADTSVLPGSGGADVPLLVNSGVINIAPGVTLTTPTYGQMGAGRVDMGIGARLRVTAPAAFSPGQPVVVEPGDTFAFGQVANESSNVSVFGTATAEQITGGGAITVRGGGLLAAGRVAQSALVLQSDGTNGAAARIGPGPTNGATTSRLASLVLSGPARLDLTNTNLVIDYAPAAASPLDAVRSLVRSGRAGGAWTGTGIATTAPLASRALGYAEASVLLGLSGAQQATWRGETVDATSLLVAFTVAGDADLNGSVGFADLVRLAQNYSAADGQRVWLAGDFTYDGNVDFADLVVLAQNYGGTLPAGAEAIPGAPDGFAADVAAAFASVPEPGGMMLFAVGATGVMAAAGRRRGARRGLPGGDR